MYHWNTPLKDLIREVKEHLYYTTAERRGILLLCLLTLAFGLSPYVVAWRYPKKIPDVAALHQVASQLTDTASFAGTKANQTLFSFDPNTVSRQELIALGVPAPIALRIDKYREKGGKFFKKEDLKKIYGFPEATYARLEPYIELAGDRDRQAAYEAGYPEREIPRFNFDPNTAAATELQQLGLPSKVIQNIVKYREKGGKFKYREDVARIYGMPENLYAALSPYIQLPSKNETPAADIAAIVAGNNPAPYQAGSVPKKHAGTIDINRASVEEWQQMKGIGPAFAKRIVTFRDKLGGFYTVGQVAETFGLPDSTFQKIKPQLVPSPIVNKIKINTVSLEVLMTHPYIKRNIAQIILNYRAQHGPFAAPEDLYRIHALSKEVVEKILPYISVE